MNTENSTLAIKKFTTEAIRWTGTLTIDHAAGAYEVSYCFDNEGIEADSIQYSVAYMPIETANVPDAVRARIESLTFDDLS